MTGSSHPLEHRRNPLAAAYAHGLQPIAALAALQLVQQGGQDAHAGGADGVAQGDAGAVDVELVVYGSITRCK